MPEVRECILTFVRHPKLNVTHTCMGHLNERSDEVVLVFKILHVVGVDLEHLVTLPMGEQALALYRVTRMELNVKKWNGDVKVAHFSYTHISMCRL